MELFLFTRRNKVVEDRKFMISKKNIIFMDSVNEYGHLDKRIVEDNGGILCNFYKGKLYRTIEDFKDYRIVAIKDEFGDVQFFYRDNTFSKNNPLISDYFYTKEEMRLLKIESL